MTAGPRQETTVKLLADPKEGGGVPARPGGPELACDGVVLASVTHDSARFYIEGDGSDGKSRLIAESGDEL